MNLHPEMIRFREWYLSPEVKRHRVAVHEAGHVLAHLALGIPLGCIVFFNDGPFGAATMCAPPAAPTPETADDVTRFVAPYGSVENAAVVLIAGVMAERRLFCGPELPGFGGSGDMVQLGTLRLTTEQSDAARVKAEHIIETNEAAVIAVADILTRFASAGRVCWPEELESIEIHPRRAAPAVDANTCAA